MSARARVTGILAAGLLVGLAASRADAQVEQRFGGAVAFTPFSFTSGDAPFDEAIGDALLMGAGVEYGLRLFRYGQIGAAARWVYLHRRGDESGPYGHGFELPGLLTVLIPVGKRVELFTGGGAGYSFYWMFDQAAAAGPTFEGRGGIAYKIGKSADATTEVGFTAALLELQDDTGTLDGASVTQIAVPVRIGVRGRW